MVKRILNLGCGNDHYGTDFIDLYPSRKEVLKCDISSEKLPYGDETFDKVYSAFVFEHLFNPQFTLKEISRILKKQGKIELHTNNSGWLFYHNCKSKFLTHYGGYEKIRDAKIADRHYALYTFHHLENHLKESGFAQITSELYRRDGHIWRWEIRLINWILEHSRFKWASYPQIKVIGKKGQK